MSLYTYNLGEKEVAYGYSDFVGYFFEVWDGHEIVEHQCSVRDGLTGARMAELLELHKCPTPAHITSALLDLPI